MIKDYLTYVLNLFLDGLAGAVYLVPFAVLGLIIVFVLKIILEF